MQQYSEADLLNLHPLLLNEEGLLTVRDIVYLSSCEEKFSIMSSSTIMSFAMWQLMNTNPVFSWWSKDFIRNLNLGVLCNLGM